MHNDMQREFVSKSQANFLYATEYLLLAFYFWIMFLETALVLVIVQWSSVRIIFIAWMAQEEF